MKEGERPDEFRTKKTAREFLNNYESGRDAPLSKSVARTLLRLVNEGAVISASQEMAIRGTIDTLVYQMAKEQKLEEMNETNEDSDLRILTIATVINSFR